MLFRFSSSLSLSCKKNPDFQTAPAAEAPLQTPATPGGAAWITEPAQPAAPAQFEAQPQTPKTPTGVSWSSEPAPAASTDAAAAAAAAQVF